jgi:hypothetical protein
MVTALRSWCTTRIGVVLIGAALTTLCASQRLANGLGRDSALSAAGVWSVFIVAICAYAALFFLGLALIQRLSSKAASALLISLIVGLAFAFVIVYPLLGAPTNDSGFGDRDDALTLMGNAVFSGENPFTVRTYLGNQVSPLLGAVIFAAPATVLAGSAAWMNLVLIIVLGYVAWKFLPPLVGLALSLVVATNVGFLEDFLLGGDAFLYPLALAVVSWALLNPSLRLSKPLVVGLVVVGGLLGASRANTLIVVIALLGYVVLSGFQAKHRWAIVTMAFISGCLGALSLQWAGGLDAWPFTGDVSSSVRYISAALTAIILLALASRWRKVTDVGTVQQWASTAPWLALSLLPLVVQPSALFRIWPYLAVGLPIAALAVGRFLNPDEPESATASLG